MAPNSKTKAVELPGSGAYPELTGMRALAAFAVLATHSAYWTGHYRGEGALLWARMDFGVALFFTLSGFLLFRGWVVAAAQQRNPQPTRDYFRKRAVRILPAYWLTVLVAFAFVPSDTGEGWASFLRTITFTQVYGGDFQHRGLTQMWSLCAEVAFYCLLPLLAWLSIKVCCRSRWRPGLLLICAAGFGLITPAWYVVTREWVVLDFSSIFWLPGFADWFAIGMALAVLAVQREHTSSQTTLTRALSLAPGACWLMAAALLAIAATPAAGEATLIPLPLFDALTKNLLYTAASGLMIAPLVLGASGSSSVGWLRWHPMAWLGDISYEIFLVHLIVIEGVLFVLGYDTFTGSVAYVLILTTLVSIVVAWGLRRFVDTALMRGGIQPPSHHDHDNDERGRAQQLNRPAQP